MSNLRKNFYGVSLSILAFSLAGANNAHAQTCVAPPNCATLGFTKTTADCKGHAILKCPFDQTKLFCTAFTDQNGNAPMGIGSIVYSDGTFSYQISPGKIPIGVIFDVSGLAIALNNYGSVDYSCKAPCMTWSPILCSGYSAGGIKGWANPSEAQLQIMYERKMQIDSTLGRISAIPLASSKLAYGISSVYIEAVDFSTGRHGTSYGDEKLLRCILDISKINSKT